MNYTHAVNGAQKDVAVRAALEEMVEAIRDVTVTRTGEDERRLSAAERKLHTAVHDYALAVPVTLDIKVAVVAPAVRLGYVRCEHPNAYALSGSTMYCPSCGVFNAAEG